VNTVSQRAFLPQGAPRRAALRPPHGMATLETGELLSALERDAAGEWRTASSCADKLYAGWATLQRGCFVVAG
jgi:hypothetical protein